MNPTHSFIPLSPTVFLERSGNAFASRTALIHRGGATSYGELLSRSRRLAQALARLHVGHGDKVALLMENGVPTVEAHFAIPALGALVVMLNPWLSPADTLELIACSEPKVLIADSATFKVLAESWFATPGPKPVVIISDRQSHEIDARLDAHDYEACLQSEDGSTPLDARPCNELDPIAINFTSGTTGKPKGVTYTHRAGYLHALGQVLMIGLNRKSRYLWTLPMFHVSGWGHIWANVAAGCTQIVPTTNAIQGREKEFVEIIRKEQISHLAGSPRLIRSLMEADELGGALHGLVVETGGAAPPTALIQHLESRGIQLIHQYGLNETCGPFVVNEEQDDWQLLSPEQRAHMRARQGVAALHAGTGLRVIDADGNHVPHDGKSLGEIVMAGNTVATGYYNNPEATEKAFRNGWFHSGDVAVVHPDGFLEIRDRMKDLIHVETEYGWENISSIEIENILCRHGNIRDAAVIAVPGEAAGTPRQLLVAFAELKDESALSGQAFDAYCKDALSVYKRPDKIYFSPLPKTSTGKVRKDVLMADAKRRLAMAEDVA
jgi:fatty-acyl-CoA synthase